METATAALCPGSEALAAYVDQGLRADEQTQIETHLAECDNCRLIVARVFDTQSAVLAAGTTDGTPGPSGGPGRILSFSRAHVVWGAGSLLTAAAVLTVMFNVSGRSKLADLAAAVGDERTVEARLTGGFRYGPVRAPVRSGGSSAASDDWTLYAAAGKIREDADRDPSAPNLHALGVAHLVLGQYDDAVRALEDAIAEDPEPPQYQSDLAAAYLARATHLDRPDDLPRALGAAERAITGNPTLLEARFNRALALEALFLDEQARQAWEDYLARDSASGWATDAREHLVKLQQRVTPHDGARNNSPPPITDTSVEAALDWLMRQRLPAWAEAVLADDSEKAASERSLLTSYAQQITATNGDRFPSALAALALPDGNARARATAVREFAKARAMIDADETAALEPTLRSACAQPEGALQPLCDLELSRLHLIRRQPDAANNRIQVLERSAPGSPYLEGRLQLVSAYRTMVEGGYSTAIERDQVAFQRLVAGKYLALAGTTAVQIADMFELLGFPAEAWTWRYRSLRLSSQVGDANLKYFAHVSTADSLARVRNLSGAAAFVGAVEGPAADSVPPLRRVLSELARIRIALGLGDVQTARAGLVRANEVVTRSTDGRASRLKPDLLMLEAEVERHDGQWDRARTTLENAMRDMGAERTPHRVSALLLHASIAAERPESRSLAQESIGEALRLVRNRNSAGATQPLRREDMTPAFDTASALIRADPGLQNVKGLYFTERLRNAFEGLATERDYADLAQFETALNALPPNEALVVFSFANASMLSWVVADGTVEFKEHPVTAAQVSALANRLAVQLNRNPGHEDLWRPTLAQLHALLLRDLPVFGRARQLVIVPDGPLYRIPFGALFDGKARQYVFERTTVRVAPSIALALGGTAVANAALNAVIVGDPELAGPQSRQFPRLNDARRESTTIGALYRNATVLLGSDATKSRVLPMLSSADVIHFAGHAIASPSVALPRLLLAGDPTNITLGLSAADLIGHVKPNTTVVLAACETAATTADRAASLTSISSAFLRAGASSIVATLWPVDDSSGAAFFPVVHRRLLSGEHTATAVAVAQRSCLRDPACRRSATTWLGTVVIGYR